MKSSRTILVALCALGLLIPSAVQAQLCPSGGNAATPIVCGDSLSGDTSDGDVNNFIETDYNCAVWEKDGPEEYYVFTLAESMVVNISVGAAWDAEVLLLAEFDGACNPLDCRAVAETTGDPEVISIYLDAGTYYIVVDGYTAGDSGAYTIDVTCAVCDDDDGDGYATDALACGGSDCDDTNIDINPGALEICGNAVDEDCDGDAQACPTCGSDETLDCVTNNSGTIDTGAAGTANIDDYCYGLGAYNGVDWSGPEYIFDMTFAADTGVYFVTTDLDFFLLQDYGSGVCNPDGCLGVAGVSFTVGPEMTFMALQDETYYLSVDGIDGASASFDWTLTCYSDEVCVSDNDVLDCDSVVSGDTTGLDNDVNFYQGAWWVTPGPEYVYSLTLPYDAILTLTMTMTGCDLALIVVDDDGSGNCLPRNLIDFSDEWQQVGNEPEIVSFFAAANTTYYVIVDGWQPDEYGAYDLEVVSVLDCYPLTQCGCGCVDTDTDEAHCGACDNDCNTNVQNVVDATCIAGVCGYDACLPGYLDCDTVATNGCEVAESISACGAACADCTATVENVVTVQCNAGVCGYDQCEADFLSCDAVTTNGCEVNRMNDPDHCGDCITVCSGATPFCTDGICNAGCSAGETDCSGVCVDLQTNEAYCGDCNTDCNVNVQNVQDATCTAGVCGYDACSSGFLDCDANVTNGCEVTESADVCGISCVDCNTTVYNVDNIQCDTGVCSYDLCATGFLDCDNDTTNGCERPIDNDNCGVCDYACGINATCVDSVCTCVAGYADCDAAAGCEIQLGTVDDCLDCGDACGVNSACDAVNGCGCVAGYDDCDGDDEPGDVLGCEIELGTVDNCGQCDDACAYDNATAACNAGVCEMADCDANYGDCNDDAGNGCETMLNSPDHCGECNGACGPLEECTGDEASGYSCTSTCDVDGDGDGFADAACGGPDCNDGDASINPDADESCNQIDDDCDGDTDEGFDADGDGYTSCGGDCDDDDLDINPDAFEACDSLDNDCDGATDEGDVCAACVDADHDGYDDDSCGGDDCNDNDPAINPDPETFEACDGVDNNCDGEVDEDGACDKGIDGCDCSSGSNGPLSGGALLLALVLGLAVLRRRDN